MKKSRLGIGGHRPVGRFCSQATENPGHRWPDFGFRQWLMREDFMDALKVNALAK